MDSPRNSNAGEPNISPDMVQAVLKNVAANVGYANYITPLYLKGKHRRFKSEVRKALSEYLGVKKLPEHGILVVSARGGIRRNILLRSRDNPEMIEVLEIVGMQGSLSLRKLPLESIKKVFPGAVQAIVANKAKRSFRARVTSAGKNLRLRLRKK
ncbi:MAG: hypothetical protein NUV67_00480 [archaeon]|nr:hypothetical protein [archaeon]